MPNQWLEEKQRPGRQNGRQIMDKLKKCPFCGKGLVIDVDDEGGGVGVLHTEYADCIMGDLTFIDMPVGSTLDDLAKKLNTRPLESAARAEGYKKALEDVYAKLNLNEERRHSDLEIRQVLDQLKREYERGEGNDLQRLYL